MTATVEVRMANADDIAVLAHLRARWTHERDGDLVDGGFPDRFRSWWDRQAGLRRAWLVSVEGEPVGMANLLEFERMPSPGRDPACWGYVGNLFVLAEHRGVGVGRVLMDAVEARSTEQGLERLVLNPSPRSVPFYRRLGFAPPPRLLQLDMP